MRVLPWITSDLVKLSYVIIENTIERIVYPDKIHIISDEIFIKNTIYKLIEEACLHILEKKESRRIVYYFDDEKIDKSLIQNQIIESAEMIDEIFKSAIDSFVVGKELVLRASLKRGAQSNNQKLQESLEAIKRHRKDAKQYLKDAIITKLIGTITSFDEEIQASREKELKMEQNTEQEIELKRQEEIELEKQSIRERRVRYSIIVLVFIIVASVTYHMSRTILDDAHKSISQN